jgi:hypothetical protein
MGLFSQAFGLSGGGNGGGADRPADLPPPRERRPGKQEKEAIKRHYEEQEQEQNDNPEPPRDGRLW